MEIGMMSFMPPKVFGKVRIVAIATGFKNQKKNRK